MASVLPPSHVPGPAQDYVVVGHALLLGGVAAGPAGTSDGGADGALVRRSAAARASLFASPQWVAALHSLGVSHFDATHEALAPALGALTAAGEPPSECRVPSLVGVVTGVTRTACGDCAAVLADPTGEVDALFMADVAADVRVGTAVHARGSSVLCPAFAPRMMCVLIAKEHVVNMWHPTVPAPVARAPTTQQQQAQQQPAAAAFEPMPPPPDVTSPAPEPPMVAPPMPAREIPQPLAPPACTMDDDHLSALDVDDADLL